jgi:ubiquinone biosynthesis accessory factor UbiJ
MSPLTPFESLLNRNIAQSSAAQLACRKLEGKSLSITVSGTPLQFSLKSVGERVVLASGTDAAADARLTGSPLALARLTRDRTALTSQSVHIEGDAEVAQGFAELLQAAKPDLEEELSRLIGDVAAHQLGQAARTLFRFGERAGNTFARNLSEFLQEESRDLPTRTEADEFVAAVDTLRDDVERMGARIDRLERARLGDSA